MRIEIVIRPACPEDAGAICAVSAEALGYPSDALRVRRRLSRLDASREAAFVAVVDGAPIGFVHVERYDLLFAETMANLLGLAVKGEYRGQGIGARLLREAEHWAASQGIAAMRLNSGAHRSGAHAFYRRSGYVDDGEQLRLVKALVPARKE